MTRLPSFVVLGQGKAGTSLIYRVLERNPAIGLSQPKELHYFSGQFAKGPDWYAQHFAHIDDGAMVGEVSPSYLAPHPVRRIAEHLGRDTKVIFVLRRPIERAYSRYLQNICAKEEPGGFWGKVEKLDEFLAQTEEAIARCYDLFGADNVLPMMFERDIATEAPGFEARILSFLGLPPEEYGAPLLQGGRVNPGVMPRYLYAQDKATILRHAQQRYIVPKQSLMFCAQERNSRIMRNPAPQDVAEAMARQSSWTTQVTKADYAALQTRAVLPAADRLEARFGLDLSHWRCAPRQIVYAPSMPPERFRKDLT
ncbi:sulfotransferase domain-containing protein [Tropicibacter naphthalenivorans]|uniref:Uncharacterized protein n=1 Tax=Tropicibacter naphthalenivorans TaxID=441103 RepID=A0A0P1GKN8_9RHOB|nr:sulfotransferase domain-containing protein [Tropicibacter naphthalenivorans]CUH82630.1 hypothetical protein TRN7648_04172 [Tropicibacter naphthalenivorans]SMD08980.1 Sulfotransferase family protein [Tropicibacter naphthalenivorans]